MSSFQDEYTEFCAELVRVARRYGIDREKMTSIIAEATRNRERQLDDDDWVVDDGEVREIHIEPREVLYGPPPMPEVYTIEVEPRQVLYGPPPMPEASTVPPLDDESGRRRR